MSVPTSVEAAGAELGAAITRIGTSSFASSDVSSTSTSPPSGMHSSFSTHPIPSSELFVKLHALLGQLKYHHNQYVDYWNKEQEHLQQTYSSSSSSNMRAKLGPPPQPLTAAPSILAVLMKVLSISHLTSKLRPSTSTNVLPRVSSHSRMESLSSSTHSASSANNDKTSSNAASSNPSSSNVSSMTSSSSISFQPPMLSTALRNIWVECVVICVVLGETLNGRTRVDFYAFLRKMMEFASLNPKSARASGGT